MRYNRKNLEKLASYLEKLPDDYEHFDMRVYYDSTSADGYYEGEKYAEGDTEKLKECGTVACALGHGPAAGIVDKRFRGWVAYISDNFLPISENHENLYNFLFSDAWSLTDNTPRGAARRIRYLLKHDSVPVLEMDSFRNLTEESMTKAMKLYNEENEMTYDDVLKEKQEARLKARLTRIAGLVEHYDNLRDTHLKAADEYVDKADESLEARENFEELARSGTIADLSNSEFEEALRECVAKEESRVEPVINSRWNSLETIMPNDVTSQNIARYLR